MLLAVREYKNSGVMKILPARRGGGSKREKSQYKLYVYIIFAVLFNWF